MSGKILQFGDVHLDRSTEGNVAHAMEQLVAAAREHQPDLIINTGDLAMKRGSLEPGVGLALREFHCRLAEVAPVVVIAGNHDLVYEDGRAGAVEGSLGASLKSGRIYLASRPVVLPNLGDKAGFNVACLPYPSRYAARAAGHNGSREDLNGTLSGMLGDVARGLASEAIGFTQRGDATFVLAYHGTIDGCVAGTEQVMSTELDVVLRSGDIPTAFNAVLCGHIHRPQTIERAVYAGSPCPLAFSEEAYAHGFEVWQCDGSAAKHYFCELTPRHRLITIDLADDENAGLYMDRAAVQRILDSYSSVQPPDVPMLDARVRFRIRLPRATDATLHAGMLRELATTNGAHSVQIDIERAAEDREHAIEIHATSDPDELLKLYAKRHPDIAEHIEAVLELSRDVERQVPPEIRIADRASEYSLQRIAWSNWRSMGEKAGEIVFDEDLGRLVCIEGPNAAGKSNVAEVEAFALWGKIPRGGLGLGEMVRQGQRTGWVQAEFRAAGTTYRVTRSISVNAKGVGAGECALEAEAFEPDQMPNMTEVSRVWRPASGGTSRETQKIIEGLVGSFELYLSTRFASQGDIDRLLDMTPSQLKDALQEALGTPIFESRRSLGEALLRDRRGALEKAQAVANLSAAAAGRIPQLEADLTAADADVVARALDEADADAQLDQARKNFAETKEQLSAAAAKAETVKTAIAALERAKSTHQRIESEITTKQKTLAALDEVEGKAARFAELKPLAEKHRQDRAAMEEVTRAAIESSKAVGLARHLLESARTNRDQAIAAADTMKQSAIAKMRSAEKAIEGLQTLPFGEECVTAGCKLVAGAVATRAQVPELQADVDRAIVAEATRRQEWDEKVLESERGHSTALTEQERLTGEVARAGELARETATAALEYSELEAAGVGDTQGRRAAAVASLETFRSELENASVAVLQANNAVAELGAPPDVAALERTLQEMASTGPEKAGALKRATEAVKAAEARVASLTGQIEELGRQVEAQRAAAGDIAGLAAAVTAGELFVRAMGRDGVPLLMLERAIPALEQHANRFLAGGPLQLVLESSRTLQSGEAKGEVVLRYSNPFGEHTVAAGSGFERVALGYALRAALAQVQAESHGVKVRHWWADEGWGAFDETNVMLGQQMLRCLAESFERVLFISHVSAIRQVADCVLRVVPDPELGSRLERVAIAA